MKTKIESGELLDETELDDLDNLINEYEGEMEFYEIDYDSEMLQKLRNFIEHENLVIEYALEFSEFPYSEIRKIVNEESLYKSKWELLRNAAEDYTVKRLQRLHPELDSGYIRERYQYWGCDCRELENELYEIDLDN